MEGLLVPLDDDWGDGSAGPAAYPALRAPGKAKQKRAASKHEAKRREKAAKELEWLAGGTIVLGKQPPAAKSEGSSRKRAPPAEDASTQGAVKRQKPARKQASQAPAAGADSRLGPAAEPAAAAHEPSGKASKKQRRGAGQPAPLGADGGGAGAAPAPAAERTDHERHGKKQKKRKLKPVLAANQGQGPEPAGASPKEPASREAAQAQAPAQKHAAKQAAAVATKAERKKAAKRGEPASGQQSEAGREDAEAAEAEAGAGAGPSGRPSGQPGLLDKMAARLSGSKFRWLNETLYTTTGEDAFELMQEQPGLFEQYHAGFQQQTRAWPQHPVDAAIRWLRQLPASLRVADFGCGDAALALAVPQRVACLDLVAAQPGVIECNMADTPLETGSMDVAVFCLALMGTDYPAFLAEAARVLRAGGWLWVAEVRSRFAGGSGREDFHPFLAALAGLGFAHEATDAANRMFVVFRLRKQPRAGCGGGPWPELKPCLYKRR